MPRVRDRFPLPGMSAIEGSSSAASAPSHVEDLANSGDARHALTAERLSLPADLLDGGEVVILALKPSLWFVPLDALKWVMASVLAAAGSAWLADAVPQLSQTLIIQMAAILAGVRSCVALLRWATRHYVLTNRRIMRIRGVLRPDICVCPLLSIQNSCVAEAAHERLLQIGTIRFGLATPETSDPSWYEIARPHEVHAEIRRAIRQAIDSHSHA